MDDRAARLQAEAESLLRAGRRAPAIAAYRRLLAMQPGHADAWFNLGYLLRHAGQPDAALAAYAEAIACGVPAVEDAHVNRAALLVDLNRHAAARTELEAALAIAPQHAAALLNLGNLHEDLGDRAAAIARYRQATDLGDPTSSEIPVLALARLAELVPPRRSDDPLLQRLRQAAGGDGRLDDATRADAWFAIGRALDRLEQPAAAFDAFARGKRAAHRSHPAYAPDAARRATDALLHAFDGKGARAGAEQEGPVPLFICGMFRSGSTLLEQVLAAHPEVHAGGELALLPRLVRDRVQPFPQAAMAFPPAEIDALARHYLEGRAQRFPHASAARYLTDKRPDNLPLIGLAKRLFPRAKVVFTHRHPMDTGLSVFMQHLNPRRFAYAASLPGIAHQLGQQQRLLAHWRRCHPEDVHVFDYDAFVAAPEAGLASLLRFLDLPWHPGCLDFHALDQPVRTASAWQVRQPLHGRSSGRWRRYGALLDPLRDALAEAGVAIPD